MHRILQIDGGLSLVDQSFQKSSAHRIADHTLKPDLISYLHSIFRKARAAFARDDLIESRFILHPEKVLERTENHFLGPFMGLTCAVVLRMSLFPGSGSSSCTLH